MLLMEEFRREREGVFIAYRGEEAYRKALTLEFRLREKDIRSEVDHRSGSFKSQLKVADRRSFKFALIIGEDEVKNDYFTLKELSTGKQERINSFEELLARL
jgi:histidyl-tRNA synthetase